MNIKAYQNQNQAGMAAQSGDPAAMEQYNLASINSIIAGAASGGVYAVYWGVFAVATYVIYLATAATGYIIIKSGNHYLTPLMNSIVGYGLLGLGPIFLVLGLIWKVNTEIGYRIINGEIVGRVKDTMISGNVYECLSRIESISKDVENVYGSAKIPAIKKPINIAAIETAFVMRVAKNSSSPQPVSP